MGVMSQHIIHLCEMIKNRRIWNNYMVGIKFLSLTTYNLLIWITRPYCTGGNPVTKEDFSPRLMSIYLVVKT
jgi:hypothetical protein